MIPSTYFQSMDRTHVLVVYALLVHVDFHGTELVHVVFVEVAFHRGCNDPLHVFPEVGPHPVLCDTAVVEGQRTDKTGQFVEILHESLGYSPAENLVYLLP